ncbi:hypothetical protein [Niallia circulans]|uniref:hypothetical protein n=1 Tax=Niallia circulans TaxID=1397 RepID=UPI0035254632
MPFCGNPSNFGGDLELLARNTETRAKLSEGILGYQPILGLYQPNFRFISQSSVLISQISDLSAKPQYLSANLQIYQPNLSTYQPIFRFISQTSVLISQSSQLISQTTSNYSSPSHSHHKFQIKTPLTCRLSTSKRRSLITIL